MQSNDQLFNAAKNLFLIWNQIALKLQKNPTELPKSQWNFWQNYLHLSEDISGNMNNQFDKRFKHDDWKNNFLLDLIRRSYVLFSQHSDELINNIAEGDTRTERKLRFYMQQFTDAVSPTNFPNLNPEIFYETLNTSGANLVSGIRQFFADLDFGTGKLNAKMVDMEFFKIGENIAITPGKVVFQNEILQLIEYTPTTKECYEIPLLIFPPWVNKYYILDLQEEDSLVRWLVAQGFKVFIVSWVNPTSKQRDLTFSDYLIDGALATVNTVKELTKRDQVNMVGYCIGGTLLGCMLAYLAKKKNNIVHSATFITTLFDFSEPGDLGVFMDEEQIADTEKSMEKEGYLDGNVMAATFNALRANDLIWSTFINNYLKGQKPKQFDLLYWNADPTNIPAQVHSFYLRNMYLHNYLIKPNKIILGDESLNLGKIKLPTFFLATKDDHIIPWGSCFKSQSYLSSPVKFVLASSGHVAGVVNPPQRKKYGYWTNEKTPNTPKEFLDSATYHEGSWWTEWVEWLKKQSGNLEPLEKTKRPKVKALENAPGSYVMVRIKT
jgi:polyhydroxyalkanoate synthase subunit PhaC